MVTGKPRAIAKLHAAARSPDIRPGSFPFLSNLVQRID